MKKLFKKLTRKIIFGFAALIVIGAPIAYLFLLNANNTQAAWYNDNWAYRKAITVTVTSSAADISNLQTLLTVDTTGITAKVQSSCQDLRFTSATGALLPYYIDTCSNNSATNKIWVMADLVPKNTTTYTMYMYYGNPSASAGSDADTLWSVRNLKRYWTLNDTSGNTVTDSSVNASNGTATDANTGNGDGNTPPSITTGQYGNARTFDGTDDYVPLSQPGITSAAFTVSAWYKKSSGFQIRVGGEQYCGAMQFMLDLNSTSASFVVPNSAGTCDMGTVSTSLSSGVWNHVVGTFDGTNTRIYVNGVLKTTDTSWSGSFNTSPTEPFVIGRYDCSVGCSYGSGQVDDVRIYNRVFTADEIAKLYTNPGTIATTAVGTITPSTSFASEEKSPGPIAYWKFDDGTGTTAEDSTANNLDGTLNNTPTWRTEDFCISGKCLFFDGTSNENVSKSDDAKLDFAASDSFTIGAWVKRNGTSSANNFIITKAQSGYTGYKLYQDASGDYCFDVSDGTNTDTACTSAVDFDDDRWHLVQGVKSGTSSLTLYVDGLSRATDSSIAATGTLANTGTFYIGVDLDGTSNEWLGFIDEVKVYPYARSAAQVKTDYDSRGSTEGTSAVIASDPRSNLANGLVGYWKMDEAAGATSAVDFSGNANTGTYTNGATTAAGKFGNGGSFDGTNDYISFAHSTTYKMSGALTVSLWFKTSTAVGDTRLISTNSTTNVGYNFNLVSGNGTLQFNVAPGGTTIGLYSTSAVTDNVWHHAVGTWDGATQRLYIDGALQGTNTGSGSISYSQNLLLGANNSDGPTHFFNGSLDEARIYNRALSPAEISQLYNFAPGPIAHYTFDDNTGSSVKDSSGNASTGTWTGSTTHWTPGKFGSGANVVAGDYVSGTLAESPAATTVSFWAKDSTSNTWNYYTNSGGTQYVNGVPTSFTNKYYYLSGTTLNVGLAGKAPNDSTLSTNLKTWQKADSISGVANGASVSSWTDSSGNSNTFGSAGGGANLPTYVTSSLGSRPAVRFSNSGSSGLLSTNATFAGYFNGTNKAYTIMNAYKRSTTTSVVTFFSLVPCCAGDRIISSANPNSSDGWNWYVKRNNTSEIFQIHDGEPQDTNGHISTAVDSGTLASLYKDGTLLGSAGSAATLSITQAQLGYYSSATDSMDGDIPELLVFNTALSSSDRAQMETYLGCKYGITVSGASYTCFNGVIDDFKVYNYARTQKQIVEDMNGGHPAVGSPVGSAIGHWKFDEGYLTTAYNSGNQGSTLNGTLTNSPTWTNSGKFGKALTLSGTAYVNVPNNTSLNPSTALTISTWIRYTSLDGSNTVVAKTAGDNTGYYLGSENTGSCYCLKFNYNTDLVRGTTDLSANQNTWLHVAAVYDGSTAKIYVNGKLEGTDTSVPTSITSNSSALTIGSGSLPNGTAITSHRGQLDDFKIYNYALTADQVKLDMNRSSSQVLGTLSDKSTPTSNQAAGQIYCIPGDTASCNAPISEWNFEENTGSTANDSSGNAHTGTWSGTAQWAPAKFGSGALFNGSSTIGVATPQSYMVNAATVSFWVKAPASTDNNSGVFIVSAAAGAAPSALTIGNNTDEGFTNELITFYRLNNTHTANSRVAYTTSTRTELFDNKWHFVTLTFSGSSNGTKIYIDGISKTTQNVAGDEGIFQPGNGAQTANSATIGNGLGLLKSGTVIDQLRFYNYVRTPAQIAWDYNFGKPVGHWKFNECQGATANDSSGNSLTGTLTATSTIGTCTTSSTFWGGSGGTGAGKFNYAPTFNGTGDYFTVGSTGKTINSVSLWVKPSSTTQNILDLDGGTHTITVSSGTISANGFSSPTIYVDGVATSTLPDTNWHLITVTTATGFSASNMVIGKVSTNYYSGQIDETQIYNYALTATQVKTLYNQGSAVRFGPSTGSP